LFGYEDRDVDSPRQDTLMWPWHGLRLRGNRKVMANTLPSKNERHIMHFLTSPALTPILASALYIGGGGLGLVLLIVVLVILFR
jgi:hypothetical protein